MRRASRLSQVAPLFSHQPIAGRRCLASISNSKAVAPSALSVRTFSHRSSGLRSPSAAAAATTTTASSSSSPQTDSLRFPLESLPSPPVSRALSSAKLAALHSRLSLPDRFPLQTLARTLVTASADPDPRFNNSSFAVLGNDLLGNYVAEHIICHYPRIPMSVLFAAQAAYVGPKALKTIAREWGVESVAEPGGEVDPGLLQHRRLPPGTQLPPPVFPDGTSALDVPIYRRVSTRVVYDHQFGDMKTGFPTTPATTGQETIMVKSHGKSSPIAASPESLPSGLGKVAGGITSEDAYASFVRALVGAIYIHCGRVVARRFITAHFLSRSLDISTLFDFRNPTRDLAILCGREGFEPPVARLLSETGRLSRHAVFVVGIFSGQDKLGEGAGSSLVEARTRAATAALASWYLYSPLDVTVPSEAEDGPATAAGAGSGPATAKRWIPNYVDCGEIFR